MARHRHSERRQNGGHDDPVRREAYEQAMQRIRGRAGLCDLLSDEDRRAIRAFDGPEVLGTWPPSGRQRG